jgi:E3 ubiquitin-protein ligase UBR4
MTYPGEQGQQIKALINSHSIRRTSMCCVASRTKKHLVVAHEKGKQNNITVLQLNALLQGDETTSMTKRQKLTLTKLNTMPVPFVLVSIVVNPCNEDYLALTGLKECQVIYLDEQGHSAQDLPVEGAACGRCPPNPKPEPRLNPI